MRYYKCKETNTTEIIALKTQYSDALKNEKQIARKEKTLNTIASILFYTVSTACFVGCNILIGQIPIPQTLFFRIIHFVGKLLLWICSIFVSGIIGGLVSVHIWNKIQRNQQIIKQSILSQACLHLREYYQLQEPCIVTKCYDSSDKKFINHDVCIFVVGDELRITTNLKHGFFHLENDLGCYAFTLDEIFLTKRQGENFLIAELKAGDTFFMLGYRAKGFIEKNFIFKSNKT